MAKITFSLSSEKAVGAGGIDPLNAPMIDGGRSGGLRAPVLHSQDQEAATLPTPRGNTPLLDPQVVQHGTNLLVQSALNYQDRTDDLNASDAAMRARLEADDILHKIPQKEGDVPGFMNFKGKEAIDTSGSAQERIKKIYDEDYANGLSGNARMKYLARVAPHKEADLVKIANHTVKQQEWYRGQVQFGQFSLFAKTFEQDPDRAMQIDFPQGLALYQGPEEQAEYRKKTFEFAIDSHLSKPGGVVGAIKFLNSYGDMADPQSRLKAVDKINPALKAYNEQLKAEKEEHAKIQQAEIEAQAPIVLANNIYAGDPGAVVKQLEVMSSGFTGKDAAKGVAKQAEAMDAALWFMHNNGKNSYEIEQYGRNIVAAAGGALSPVVANQMAQTAYNISKVEREKREQARDNNAVAVVKKMAVDPRTNKLSLPPEVNVRALDLPAEKMKDFLSIQAGTNKEIADLRTTAQIEDQYNQAYVAAILGKLPEGSPEYNAVVLNQATDKRLPDDKMKSIVAAVRGAAEKDPSIVDFERKKLIEEVDRLGGLGMLSAELDDKGDGKPYDMRKLDSATLRAQAEILQEYEQWRKNNKTGDSAEWLDNKLKRMAVTTGGINIFGRQFMGKENYLKTQKTGGQTDEKGNKEGKGQGQGRQGVLSSPGYGVREDGTQKGKGFLGEVPTPDGKVMTELSIGVDMGGVQRLIPALVPTLSQEEVSYLAGGGKPTPEIVGKAVAHAQERMSQGQGVFADNNISPAVQDALNSPKYRNILQQYNSASPEDRAKILQRVQKMVDEGAK